MIIFFVVDRPASLEILKGLFAMIPDQKFGLLTHAFVSKNFIEKFRGFPYKTPLKYFDKDLDEDELNKSIEDRIIKFVDSGIFNEKSISYKELFKRYEELSADYGVIIDFLNDKEQTLKSAEEAIKIYRQNNYNFKLVGVAQGKNEKDYIECYEALLKMGYEYIAIGGLLRRLGSSNYLNLRSEKFLIEVINEIKKQFNPRWLFTLGVFHPKRKKLLEDLGIWGADYKGWLFQYEEDYSFIEEYIPRNLAYSMFVKHVLSSYKVIKNLYKLLYSNKNEKEIAKLERNLLDKSLNKIGLSLKMLRYKRVRESLVKIF